MNPPARYLPALAYDVARGRTVLFGGDSRQDTWEWDGKRWLERSPSSALPPPRSAAGVAWDYAANAMLVHGGNAGFSTLGDTWRWDGGQWRDLSGGAAPGNREGAAIIGDPDRKVVVLFGGRSTAGSVASGLGDTWEWDGAAWTEKILSAPPPPRASAALAYDGKRKRALLFGGISPTKVFPGINPTLQDLWSWNGTAWTVLTPTGLKPPPRAAHAMTWDQTRDRLVVSGGFTDGGGRLDDVWEWDGTAWAEVTPTVRLAARVGASMVYDPLRKLSALFGGISGSPSVSLNELWEWSGAAFASRTVTGAAPAGRSQQGMVYDAVRQAPLVFGGFVPNSPTRDLWEWSAASGRQPAVQLLARTAGSGISAGAITGLRVRASCTGNAPSGPGAALWGWSTAGLGSWKRLASNAASAATDPYAVAPTGPLLSFEEKDRDAAQSFVVARDELLSFQCRPVGASGASEASVALDYLEVRVRYRP